MSGTIRAFIAIELNLETRELLSSIQIELKKTRADVKWVKPENIHLTIKFLGNINSDQANEIKKILSEVARENNQFDIDLSEVGAFPKKEYPRVIWVGVEKNKDKVAKIAADLEERIVNLGIPKEDRPFQSHITIGRVRSNDNRADLVDKLKTITLAQKPSLLISKLTLFKSTLSPSGPIYEILSEANLKTS